MKVFIDSPHCLILSGLASIVGKRHEIVEEAFAEVVIRDLCSYSFPYPEASSLPTLALFCGSEQDLAAVEILRAGYRGYLRLDEGEERLELALQALLRGENWAERLVIGAFFDQRQDTSLTPREGEIYALVLQNFSNQEVAQRLGLSVNTVKSHMSRLLHKLQVSNRRELLIRATSRSPSMKELILRG